MAGNTAAYHQNFISEKKPLKTNYPFSPKQTDIVEKDIRKWVESVVEFKAKLDKQKVDGPLEKHLKKNKKFKTKKKPSLVAVQVGSMKTGSSGQNKTKTKKPGKRTVKKTEGKPKDENQVIDFFDVIKDTYRSLKLPANWTSGLSNNRVVFNRIKVTTQNTQQKMIVERSLVITKDCTSHVLVNGAEITFANWDLQKINAIDDIKKAIKDIDSLRICEGAQNGTKSPQCFGLVDNSKQKLCEACKSETTSPPKPVKKKQKVTKKSSGAKEVSKQKSFQK